MQPLQAKNEPRELTALESLNKDFDIRNDNYCGQIERLEILINKLHEGGTDKEPGGKESQPQQPGLITDYLNYNERFGRLNSRLESAINKLQQLV